MSREAMSTHTLDLVTKAHPYAPVDHLQEIAAIMQALAPTCAEPLALVVTTLHFEHERKSCPHKAALIDASVRYFLENLRSLVRKTDVVCLLGRSLYFILRGANLQGGNIVQDRLWDALVWRVHNTNEGEALRPSSLTMGHSAFPAPCDSLQQCIALASTMRKHFNVQPEKSARQMSVPSSRDNELPTLARQLGVPYLSLLPRKLPATLQAIVTPSLAQELHCYPLGRARNTLTVAMSDPRDSRTLDRLRQETGLRIFPVLAPPHELQTALEQLV